MEASSVTDLNDSFQKVSAMKVLNAITDLMLYFRYVRTPAKERYSNPLTWKVCITTPNKSGSISYKQLQSNINYCKNLRGFI